MGEQQKQTLYDALKSNGDDGVRKIFEKGAADININHLCMLYKEIYQGNSPISKLLQDTSGYVKQSLAEWLCCQKYKKYKLKAADVVDLERDIGALLTHLLKDGKLTIYKETRETTEKATTQDLFIWAILANKWKVGHVLWRFGKHQLGAALIGCALLKALAEKADEVGELQLCQDLKHHGRIYEDLAVGVVAQCHGENRDTAHQLLVRQMKDYGNKTLFSLSNSYSMMTFLGSSCCQTKLNRLWKGNISPYTPTWKMILCFFLPMFIPFITAKEENETEDRSCDIVANKLKPFTEFYKAPVIIFMAYTISYLVFLAIFTVFVLTDLHPDKVSTLEYITWAWIGTYFLDEVRQLLSIDKGSLLFKIRRWFESLWNRFDLIMYSTFFLAVVVRFIDKGDFGWARTIYSISLTMFIVRIIQGFMVSKRIGPKVIVLGNMLLDVLLFVGVFLVFLFSFGVMYQANLYPNSTLSWDLLKSIVYIPYWQLYGELFLEEMKGEHDGACSRNESVWQHDGGQSRCPEQNSLVELLAAVYVLMSNILLVNLLIAMFSTTYQKIHDRSELVWRYYCYGIVHTLYDYPLPCPPFNIPSLVFRLVRYICKNDDGNAFSVAVTGTDSSTLDNFETEACKEYLKNIEASGSGFYKEPSGNMRATSGFFDLGRTTSES